MKVRYSTSKLEKILTDERLLLKYYSNDYQRIRNRLSQLRAAANLAEISEAPPPRRHKLNGNYKGCWGINYSKNDRLIIRPVGMYDMDDLSSIVEIEIVELEDYH